MLRTTSVSDSGVTGVTTGQISKKERRPERKNSHYVNSDLSTVYPDCLDFDIAALHKKKPYIIARDLQLLMCSMLLVATQNNCIMAF